MGIDEAAQILANDLSAGSAQLSQVNVGARGRGYARAGRGRGGGRGGAPPDLRMTDMYQQRSGHRPPRGNGGSSNDPFLKGLSDDSDD